ncbi:MAG: PD-(D/E)XK nuclease family protein [Phycisphaerales bacterium]|nr:PD-(D/E)XK nuclease family protein [Phycisphaerales bacterium]MCI0629846.1 PD-(D/E)XK nuclease family protein [Phycisphaerales bacterium]MCI0674857.1 PD-(D/E)XK nuclease family protein [Phycisphaerales bacterium]
MSDPQLSAIEALEKFVVDNDDLLALEERIGRFNIFDSLGIARAEIRHSNFLAWLVGKKSLTRQWHKIYSEVVLRIDEDEELDEAQVHEALYKELKALSDRLAGVPEALCPIFDQSKETQPALV